MVERSGNGTPWEKLGIDWRDYHPAARTILDDPFFWECGDDFAPHGNDTGADLLADYRKWLKGNPAGDPVEFYRREVASWGVADDGMKETMKFAEDEAAVALAFAELKLRGECREAVAVLARAALGRHRERALGGEGEWREVWLGRVGMMEGKLG